MFGVTNSTCDDSLICTVIVTLRWVKCLRTWSGAQWTAGIFNYEKKTKASHESHMSRLERRFAHTPDLDHVRGSRVRCRAPERVFAAVRPGFVAPCMVKAVAGAGGRLRCLAGPLGSRRRPARPAWPNPSRAPRPRPGSRGSRPGAPVGRDVRYRASRNRQREYLAEDEAWPLKGVWCVAAITAREYADARDLPLATLSS
jgi:hypothetical protein